ncbi:hypothetical protein VCHA39O220_40258 [Vibrio chagasii]|nr:hypothetical protein VCHA41O246_30173 [Vibrio chagasii]CAH7256496.1 hypothetical protein VCHA39O220_40258 [Vibrio chagasii]CAH7260205.1 hypothetical protein VCHA39O224_10156 [Vibrio chagasii]CAH7348035.1 hypothetical protein VCHA40P238_50166 [Vibrio chagasii]
MTASKQRDNQKNVMVKSNLVLKWIYEKSKKIINNIKFSIFNFIFWCKPL